MTLTRNELVLLSKAHTDVLRIIIIINNQYRYVFVPQQLIRSRYALAPHDMNDDHGERKRAKRAATIRYTDAPMGVFISITYMI